MKKIMLHTLLAAGVIICGASAPASEGPVLSQHAQTLASLASDMELAFDEDLRTAQSFRSLTLAELRLRESLCQLAGITGQFHRAVEQRAPACDLERGLGAILEAMACAEGCSRGIKVCAEICGMYRQFEQTMACVAKIDLEEASRCETGHAHSHRHQHHEGQVENSQGPNDGTGWFRVPMAKGGAFLFRQPMR